MKTTGTLIPEVRAALRRGDCAGARSLVGDAQRGRLTARQQTTVARLLKTVERCDIRHGVGAPRRGRDITSEMARFDDLNRQGFMRRATAQPKPKKPTKASLRADEAARTARAAEYAAARAAWDEVYERVLRAQGVDRASATTAQHDHAFDVTTTEAGFPPTKPPGLGCASHRQWRRRRR